MNRYIIFSIFLLIGLSACNDDFLERYPLDEISPQTFFQTEAELNTYVNSLYSYLPGEGVFNRDFSSDNVEKKSYDQVVAGQHTVETDAEEAGWTWGFLRDVNFFLANYDKNEDLEQEVKNHYAGIARFFRAWFYFDKVKRFGDVPFYDQPLEASDEDLFKSRDSRDFVIGKVLEDLDFAIANVRENTPSMTINKWAALALKARVALHEGTFCKYHGRPNAASYLATARDAAKQLMDAGQYTLYSTANPQEDYQQLFLKEEADPTEVILARVYDASLEAFHRGTNEFISSTLNAPGLTKSMINTYLMADGTPFTDQEGADTMQFFLETQNRDPRLAQTIRTPGYTRIGGTDVLVPDFNNARTGYQIIKYVLEDFYDVNYNVSTNDLPIFRYAEILLIYAEAKAELGELTQNDLDISVNLIRQRAGMPDMVLANLAVDPVLKAQYPNVSGAQEAAILEIRRERRVELILEGFRYDDLMRWRVGDLMAETFMGMYFPSDGAHDLDKDGEVDVVILETLPEDRLPNVQYWKLGEAFVLSEGDKGNLIVHPTITKVFNENQHYFFPLPRTELLLNPNLEQNPGW